MKLTIKGLLLVLVGCAPSERFVGTYLDHVSLEANRLTLRTDHTFSYTWEMDIDLSRTTYTGRWWSNGDTVFLQSLPQPRYCHLTIHEDHDQQVKGTGFEALDLDSVFFISGVRVLIGNSAVHGIIGMDGRLVLPLHPVQEFTAIWDSHWGQIDTVHYRAMETGSNVFRIFAGWWEGFAPRYLIARPFLFRGDTVFFKTHGIGDFSHDSFMVRQ